MSEHNVGDSVARKSRVLKRMCGSCIYRRGNPVMDTKRLVQFEREALARGSFIPCHSTYAPLGKPPTSICRGFFARNKATGVLALMERLWGFVFVDPLNKGGNP